MAAADLSTEMFYGKLWGIAIYNKILSASEVLGIYNGDWEDEEPLSLYDFLITPAQNDLGGNLTSHAL